uniref:Uncharacterized protein n=1 Tax=Anguilla anguilla TaxID=7936 RepID=A0A0E9UCK1_ANGAN
MPAFLHSSKLMATIPIVQLPYKSIWTFKLRFKKS